MPKPKCPICAGTGQVYPEDYDVTLGKPITRHEPCGACKGTGQGEAVILQGHVLDVLATLPAESVSCVVTSPPYWSLRKYEALDVVWGGEPECDHEWGVNAEATEMYSGSRRWQHLDNYRGTIRPEMAEKVRDTFPGAWQRTDPSGATCSRCGAWRGQYGLEPTPELYVEHTLDVLRAIRRVLRPDGCIFWNIGDGYASAHSNEGDTSRWQHEGGGSRKGRYAKGTGLKPKDLVLMPFRVALAAQADGWWVRSVIIWSKPNCMPESCKDRPTTAHEYVLMLTKNGTNPLYWYQVRGQRPTMTSPPAGLRGDENIDWEYVRDAEGEVLLDNKGKPRRRTLWEGVPYWYDQEAVREAYTESTVGRFSQATLMEQQGGAKQADPLGPYQGGGNANKSHKIAQSLANHPAQGRNLRSVWEFPTAQTPEAHFATFPEELPRRCIEASCPREICAKCGTARVRVVEQLTAPTEVLTNTRTPTRDPDVKHIESGGHSYGSGQAYQDWAESHPPETTGWTSCACAEPDYQPGIVLDPFAGIGTTGIVAKRLGRRFIGIELSEKYAAMARDKLALWWRRTELVAPPQPVAQAAFEEMERS